MFYRLSIKGTLAGGEVWSVNPAFNIDGELPTDPTQLQVQSVAQGVAAVTIPASIRNLISSSGAVTTIRAEARRDNGELIRVAEAPVGSSGTGQGVLGLPLRSALVVSLHTSDVTAKGRGRIYWPALRLNLNTNGRVDSTLLTSLATDFATYLHAIETGMNAVNPTPLVSYKLGVYSPTDGVVRNVQEISVGDIPDRQQRRQDKIVQARAFAEFRAGA